MLHYDCVLLTDQIPGLVAFTSIAIIFFPICNVINFEINLNFNMKPSSYMTKNVGTKIKYLKNEKSF